MVGVIGDRVYSIIKSRLRICFTSVKQIFRSSIWMSKQHREDGILKNFLAHLFVFLVVITIYSFVFRYIYLIETGNDIGLVTSIYWTVMTMTTVGYGDIILVSSIGQLYSVLVAITGIGLIFGLLVPFVVIPWAEGRIKTFMLPIRPPERLKKHVIICGYNPLVEVLVQELIEHKHAFVVLENDESTVRRLQRKGIPVVFTDPSDEDALIEAGIKEAKTLIANKSDEENAAIVLTAREICNVEIIALVDDLKKANYLRYAGATRILSPKTLLGIYIGRKSIYRLTDQISDVTEVFEGLDISEFFIYSRSVLIGRKIGESEIWASTGTNIIGIWSGGYFHVNSSPNEVIRENSVLLASGTREQLTKLKRLTW